MYGREGSGPRKNSSRPDGTYAATRLTYPIESTDFGIICLAIVAELQESFATAPPERSKYSIRIGTRCPAVRLIEPDHSVAACGANLSIINWLFTHSRTPSSVVVWKLKVPLAGAVMKPLHRTE